MKPYYLVKNQQQGFESARIDTQADAITHAESLAHMYPGAMFQILKVIAITRVPDSITFYVDGEGPEE